MFGFSLERNRLRNLIRQGKQAQTSSEKEKFKAAVRQFFGKSIKRSISNLGPMPPARQRRIREILPNELGHLLQRLSDPPSFFLDNYEWVVTRLAVACHWKVTVRDQLRENPGQMATVSKLGAVWQEYILTWLRGIVSDPQPTDYRVLLTRLGESDLIAIANRTLRAILALMTKNATCLFVLDHDTIVLDRARCLRYLHEQISLYFYLFNDENKVDFLLEELAKIKQWLIGQFALKTSGTFLEPDAEAQRMIDEIQDEFLKKRTKHRDPQHPFFLDTSLRTYLIGYLKKEEALIKALGRQNIHFTPDDSRPNVEELAEEDSQFTHFFYGDAQSETGALQADILAVSKRQLRDDCRKLIELKFNNNYGQVLKIEALATILNEQVGPLSDRYRRCWERLKQLVSEECRKRNVKLYPR